MSTPKNQLKSEIKSMLGISALVSLYGIVSLLIWFIGPSVGFSGVWERVILIALILLTWPVIVLINNYRSRRSQAKPTIDKPKAKENTIPISEELTSKIEEVVQWLHSTKLGSEPVGDAVYQLPWFLIVGPPASGKSSLALSASLDFHMLPSQRRAEQNFLRPTANCEWRITDSMVLVDTAGHYQSEGLERQAGMALIEAIKKYRKKRPLDGMLMVINAANIVAGSDNEIEQQAKILRARLDDTIQQVNLRFPIYLIFTHVESIEGFTSFFHDFGVQQRGQIWGTTIPLEQVTRAHALFDVEFDYLYDTLIQNRLVELKHSLSSIQQLEIFNFPLCFAQVRRKLGLFISVLFRPSPLTEPPLLRGFYFTSCANISATPDNAVEIAGSGHFVADFFQQVLLADKDIAASFQTPTNKKYSLPSILLASSIFLSLLVTLVTLISFLNNRTLLNNAVESALRVEEITRSGAGKDLLKKDATAARVEIEALESLRTALVKINDHNNRRWTPQFITFHLTADSTQYLRAVYFDAINARFFKSTITDIEQELRNFATEGNLTTGKIGEEKEEDLGHYYDLLKVYLMLSDLEKVEPVFLANQLAGYWKKSAPADMELLSQQQLLFYSQQAVLSDTPHIKTDDKLVTEVRRKLTRYPAINRFYKRITTDIDAKVSPITLDGILQGAGQGWLSGTYSVPGSFTIEGYKTHIVNAMESAAEEISKDDWVMGADQVLTKGTTADVGKLQTIYFRDYVSHWQQFVKGIKVRQFNTKDDATEALKLFSRSDSPLVLVMNEVERNTNTSASNTNVGIWQSIKQLFSRSQTPTAKGTEVEKEYRSLIQFVSTDKEKDTSAISQYRSLLSSVAEVLENSAPEQLSQPTTEGGKDPLGLQKVESSFNKLVDAFKTPATLDAATLLKQPLTNIRVMYYANRYEYIEKSWREKIYSKSQTLETTFPFSETNKEATINDLTQLLNPVNGQFTSFFNQNLSVCFEDAGGRWKIKEGSNCKFSQNFINYLNSARQLQEALFSRNDSAQPEVSYQIFLDPVPGSKVTIEIDGTRLETTGNTRESAKFVWPARSGNSGAKIMVSKLGQPEGTPLSFLGEWGLFKMVAAGNAAGKTVDGKFPLVWTVGTTTVKAELQPSKNINPFQKSLFSQFHVTQDLK